MPVDDMINHAVKVQSRTLKLLLLQASHLASYARISFTTDHRGTKEVFDRLYGQYVY